MSDHEFNEYMKMLFFLTIGSVIGGLAAVAIVNIILGVY